MTPRVRYLLCILATCCAVTLVGQPIVALSTAAADKTSCAELQDWARQHYTGAQPSLDDLARFDRAHRAAIFTALTPEARASLWREQFRRFSRRADLSDVQRGYIEEAMALATPDHYTGAASRADGFEQLWTKAASAFTSLEHKTAWHHIGAVTGAGQVSVESPKLMAGGIACNCKTTFECGGSPCGPGGGCTEAFACGTGGTQLCTGRCVW